MEPLLAEQYENKIGVTFTDRLTGLYNNGFFQISLEYELKRFERYGNKFSIALIDVDSFSHFNMSHGPLEGDLLLKEIAGLIKKNSRDVDLVARYAGNLFVVIVTGAALIYGLVRRASELENRADALRGWLVQVGAILGDVLGAEAFDDRNAPLGQRRAHRRIQTLVGAGHAQTAGVQEPGERTHARAADGHEVNVSQRVRQRLTLVESFAHEIVHDRAQLEATELGDLMAAVRQQDHHRLGLEVDPERRAGEGGGRVRHRGYRAEHLLLARGADVQRADLGSGPRLPAADSLG